MRVSLEWIKDFVGIAAEPAEIAHRLTMAGLEVEGTETVDGDTVFEVNVTPNRPDCLSILGIAREVAAVFGLPLRMPASDIGGTPPATSVKVEILDPPLCNRYTGRLLSGVTVGDTPEWMKKRLEKCGIRPLNSNIVDITNYVMLELGHPLHAFDADKIEGSVIRVARAGEDRQIRTLDGVDRNLPADALLIWDGKDPVAVAGVMGGEESGVTHSSRNIFLESAYFEPSSIRRTGKELGLKSESSYRFERGTDIVFLETALNRAALLMQETGGGTVHDIVDAYPQKYEPFRVEVSYRRVNALLGTDLGREAICEMLGRIGIPTEDRGEIFYAYPPSYRRDVRADVDIVEEVARIYSYSNIPVRTPKAVLSDGILNRREMRLNAIREAVGKAGFSEVINYSFMNPSDLDLLGILPDDTRRRHVSVRNPLRSEDSLMRTTLIPALLNNFLYNLSRGVNEISFFELSKVFTATGEQLPAEGMRLGGIFYRENIPALWRDDVPPFYRVKGAVEALMTEMHLTGATYLPSAEVFLHRGKAADIMLDGTRLGFVGEVSPGIVERLDLKVPKPELIIFELDIDKMLMCIPATLKYAPIPKYPPVARDIAIILDEAVMTSSVKETLLHYPSSFIESVELFDHYRGKHVPANKKSLAFRITYRSHERTLTDSEVESVHAGLVAHILAKTGGELRG